MMMLSVIKKSSDHSGTDRPMTGGSEAEQNPSALKNQGSNEARWKLLINTSKGSMPHEVSG